MFENKYIQQRIEKADALRELGINPYANDSKRELSIQDYLIKMKIFLILKQKEMRIEVLR